MTHNFCLKHFFFRLFNTSNDNNEEIKYNATDNEV